MPIQWSVSGEKSPAVVILILSAERPRDRLLVSVPKNYCRKYFIKMLITIRNRASANIATDVFKMGYKVAKMTKTERKSLQTASKNVLGSIKIC